jgi:hypothetical protein
MENYQLNSLVMERSLAKIQKKIHVIFVYCNFPTAKLIWLLIQWDQDLKKILIENLLSEV